MCNCERSCCLELDTSDYISKFSPDLVAAAQACQFRVVDGFSMSHGVFAGCNHSLAGSDHFSIVYHCKPFIQNVLNGVDDGSG
ncbi:MAG: hypothetical protein ACD_48C00122G0007 [uncultured bacterium]|nr:MAG: hypothetical protein ACD_48C00122G0007 [uncultured bacterium]